MIIEQYLIRDLNIYFLVVPSTGGIRHGIVLPILRHGILFQMVTIITTITV